MADTAPGGDVKASIQGRNYGQIAVGKNITQLTLNVDHGGVVHMHQPVTPVTEARPRPVDMRPRPVRELSAWQAEAQRAVAALEQGLSVELWGTDTRGRTMLLRYLAHHPVAGRFAAGVIYLDAGALTANDLLQNLYEVFFQTRPPARFSTEEIRSSLQDQEALLLLDNADRGGLGVFKFLRRATFVLAHSRALLEPEDGVSIPLADTPPTAPMLLRSAEATSPDARRLLGVMAALGDRAITAAHLAAIAQVPLAAVVAELEAAGLLAAVGDDAFALPPGLADLLARHWDLGPFRTAAAACLTDWIEARRDPSDGALPLLLFLLESAIAAAQWVDALRLGRALEPLVALAGRWDAWEQVLQRLLQAAEAVGDRQTIAYALHQLGTRLLCLGQEGARPFLERALALRQELGDSIGAGVTNLNLAQTTGSLVSSAAEGQAPTGPSVETPRPGRPAARWRGVAMATAALGLAGGVLFILFPRAPQPVLQTPALAFGEVAVDQGAPARRTAVLENQGKAPLVIRTVTLDGPGANAFHIETTTCAQAPVSPGGACRVDVLFAPPAPGQALAELHLEPEGLGRQTVSLSGTGLQGIASVKPAAVNFGEVLYDVRSASPQLQTVTLTNTGTAPIPLAAPAITGQHAGDFRVVRTTCQGTTLAPGAACTADLAFRPTDKGERTGGLTLGGKVVPLRGEGVRPFATAAPDSLLFSALTTRGGAQEQTITVTNTGTGHLAVSGIRVDGTAAAAFAIARETCTTAPLDPGKTCTITVRFTPGSQGPYQAQLALQHNGAGMTTVALTGR